jgi:protocatechuate 3,4-dioxygenase beta subunit
MTRTLPALLLVTLFVTPPGAQDLEFIRALERAQAGRPDALQSSARIAPPQEPGTSLVVRGRVYAADGRVPLPGAIVFAYHTDRDGLYDRRGSPPHSWRLKGWARTDAEGRFEFRTIRPGPYPASRIPAHVHFTVFTDDARYHGGELRFADDEFVTARERADSETEGDFGGVRPVRRDGGAEHVDFRIRLNPASRF